MPGAMGGDIIIKKSDLLWGMLKIPERRRAVEKKLFYTLVFLPLVLAVLALPFLPAEIPAHFNALGQADRWGSRFEVLLPAVIAIPFGYFLLWMGKLMWGQERRKQVPEAFTTAVAVVCVLGQTLADALTVWILILAFSRAEELSLAALDLAQTWALTAGIVMLLWGILMPRLPMGSPAGLRTAGSLKDQAAWRSSQKIGGAAAAAAGLLLLCVGWTRRGTTCWEWSLLVLLVGWSIGFWYARRGRKQGKG